MDVTLSQWLTEPGEPYTVRRNWRQRWCHRRWWSGPLTATFQVVPQVPMRGAMQIGPNKLVMHPKTWTELSKQLKVERSPQPAPRVSP